MTSHELARIVAAAGGSCAICAYPVVDTAELCDRCMKVLAA